MSATIDRLMYRTARIQGRAGQPPRGRGARASGGRVDRRGEGSTTVSLVDTGAPDAPTCPECLNGDGLPANMVSIADRLVRSLPVREAVAA